ncbi:MAG: hypothetical protein HGA97_10410 [Chlorobiaceae bacterium]|nr:hypothetical protein [Chlorobiaceae bacterium]
MRVFREEGVPDEMPVVAVSKTGWPDEAFVSTTLGEMGREGFSTGLDDPVVYTIGRYVRVRSSPVGVRKLFDCVTSPFFLTNVISIRL